MKKIILSIALMLCFGFNANAEKGINAGVTVLYGAFEVDGATEKFGSGPGAAAETKASVEGDTAEGDFGLASIFVEKMFNDKFSIGLDYVPMSAESETTENTVGTNVNKVQVDFSDLTTLYAMINFTENVYAKAGMMTVDVETNENLATGGAYPDTELDGVMFGVGYNRNLDNGTFVRLEGTFMEFDGATVTNTNDSTKSITVDGIDGYGAKLSIGKSF